YRILTKSGKIIDSSTVHIEENESPKNISSNSSTNSFTYDSHKNPDETNKISKNILTDNNLVSPKEAIVESILQQRKCSRGHQVLVKWEDEEFPVWEPLANLENTAAYEKFLEKDGTRAY
ncbi:hypothetical protein HMI56_002475, partial [Coelomomyces lativittatus]